MKQESLQAHLAQGPVFFVAPDGDDQWSGQREAPDTNRQDGPFATLHRARDVLRELRKVNGRDEPVTVLVRGGKYFFSEPLRLASEDSGTPSCQVTWAAYPGEKPVLSGGVRLTDWKAHQGKILKCEVPAVRGGRWKFRQLFCNGERMARSRYPKIDPDDPLYSGWLFIEGPAEEDGTDAFIYKPGTFERSWARPEQGEVVIWHRHEWGNMAIPITAMDESTRIIKMAHSGRHCLLRAPWMVYAELREDNRFRVENILEELDGPGQWCLDIQDGLVYFWPPDDDIEVLEVVAPAITPLIDMDGRFWRPEKEGGFTEWINIHGLTLTETLDGDNLLRDTAEHYACWPANNPDGPYCGEAIRMRLTEHCTLEHNHLDKVGGNGIYFEGYNARNVIRHNEIGGAGAQAIALTGGRIYHPERYWHISHGSGGRGYHPVYNVIEDNHIHHCGAVHDFCPAMNVGLCDGTFVRNNLFEDLPHQAIAVGNANFGRNYFEYNHIRRVALITNDTGAIHTWMEDQADPERDGNVYRYNLIEGSQGFRINADGSREEFVHSFGIYIDNCSSNCIVYGNIIAGTSVGICIHSGKNNIIENNILYDCSNVILNFVYVVDIVPGLYCGNVFRRNIVCPRKTTTPVIQAVRYTEDLLATSDENLIHSLQGGDPLFRITYEKSMEQLQMVTEESDQEYDLAGWQAQGFDAASVVADPKFEDAANGDFRLQSDSPALEMGFVPIDAGRIGIRA
jgi:parallel beta-helix repeat protein